MNSFEDLTKQEIPIEDNNTKAKNPTIYDCFKLFELPEQLGEDNAWYCSVCKDFKKATKKMEIYKAPPLLVIHFKRFKSRNSVFKKGKITETVEFSLSINELDVSEYVINEELPMEYPVERIIPTFEQTTTMETENENNLTPTPDENKGGMEYRRRHCC